MNSVRDFSEIEFESSFSAWQKQLSRELKLEDVKSKTVKNSIDGYTWPTLSVDSLVNISLPTEQKWKKSSQTYFHYPEHFIEKSILEDLASGVRLFFLGSSNLNLGVWTKLNTLFLNHHESKEIVIILCGQLNFSLPKTSLKVITDDMTCSGDDYQKRGGDTISELSLMLLNFSKHEKSTDELYLGVYVGSQFFENIAKIRAARMLGLRLLEVLGIKKKLNIVAKTSYRDWTLYERYSNILRNNVSVASALIGGADYIQSSGYESIFEIELNTIPNQDEYDRSRRVARNTSHILSLESMLGMVQDASYGSYHLESLSSFYAKSTWEKMQGLITKSEDELTKHIENEASELREKRIEAVCKRKFVLTGINDFPDINEVLNLNKKPDAHFFRVARIFEELRFQIMKNKTRPVVRIALFGDMANLSGRLNFIKNYFEVGGFVVDSPNSSCLELNQFNNQISKLANDIVVVCALDDDYEKLNLDTLTCEHKFIAGRINKSGFENIFAGQDIYQVLNRLTKKLGLYE